MIFTAKSEPSDGGVSGREEAKAEAKKRLTRAWTGAKAEAWINGCARDWTKAWTRLAEALVNWRFAKAKARVAMADAEAKAKSPTNGLAYAWTKMWARGRHDDN